MSWSGSVTARYEDAEAAINAMAVSPDTDAPDEVGQVEAAKQVALDLIKAGVVVNDPEMDVQVTISGHANPGHKPATGSANDSVGVMVTQVSRSLAAA